MPGAGSLPQRAIDAARRKAPRGLRALLQQLALLQATVSKSSAVELCSMQSRSTPTGFADRTLKNLDFIRQANDVHVVAQTGNSLLGLVVFALEKKMKLEQKSFNDLYPQKLSELESDGWPSWNITNSTCATLGQLLRELRNAVSHGHWSFDSDSRDCGAVNLSVEFEHAGSATIGCSELQTFCRKFATLLAV